ncbi:MAG: NAD(P)H-dependent oxidoreductase [Aureispira sp.]|nr:NAD(P)H-dependent oxidoreductase [Aureispira sp.]
MKKIVAFGASSSKESINKKLANFAANQVDEASVYLLDLNSFEMPIYSVDKEKESGIHPLAVAFKEYIKDADGIVISFAEHNGAYSAAFKNIFDWISRIDQDVWMNKPMFLLATSPGARGGQTVLDIAVNKFKFMNKNTITSFSLPSFYQNFSEEEGIKEETLAKAFTEQLNTFAEAL